MSGVKWVFPAKRLFLMRLEILFLMLMALAVFIFSYFQFELVRYAVLFTGLFVCVYILLSVVVQTWRQVEEKYELSPTHLQVTRKTRSKVKQEKVALKDVKHHKLDHFFLGGYVLSNKGKHLLFFNTKEEVQKFEQFMKKFWKKK